jgi:hypothetical protein
MALTTLALFLAGHVAAALLASGIFLAPIALVFAVAARVAEVAARVSICHDVHLLNGFPISMARTATVGS